MAESRDPVSAELPTALSRKIMLARLAEGVETLWPRLAIVLALGAAFIAASWFGAFSGTPLALRIGLIVLFALGLGAALWRLLRWPVPQAGDGARRLDLNDPALHRPLQTMRDAPAGDDPVARALWQMHRDRAQEAARRLAVPPPVSRLPGVDRYGLGALALLLMVASAFVAGDERMGRLSDAFRFGAPAVPPTPPRLDAWIDPPAYTGRAPIFLSGPNAPVDQSVEVPAGSTATIRVAPADGVSVTLGTPQIVELPPPVAAAGGQPQAGGLVLHRSTSPAEPRAGAPFEKRYAINGTGVLDITRGSTRLGHYAVKAIADLPPTVELVDVTRDDKEVALKLRYRMEDDYGIAKSDLMISRAEQPGARTLVPAPELGLGARSGEGEATFSAPDHPWAGVKVTMRLRVSDDLGQMAESQPREVVLPIRRFESPVARALVEQRRSIVMTPDDRRTPQIALDSLLVAPERFTRKSGDFLMLSIASRKMRTARSDADLVALAQYLWETALALDGDAGLSEAERNLRAAEDRLREAMERGAPPDEIAKLMEEMRQALNEVLRERAQQAERDGQKADPNERNRMTLTQRDLNDMLKRIEELYRQGDTAKAQELMRQLQEMMRQMQTARRRPSDQRSREMGEALDELEKLQRDQEQLRDETFRDDQKRRMGRNQPRRDQQGQQGQRRQQGQQDQGDDDSDDGDGDDQDQGDEGEDGNQGQQGQQGMGGMGGESGQGLTERQQGLRNRLKQLRDKLRKGGVPDQEGLDGADGNMGEATENLKRQQGGRAGQDQQRAIDDLGQAGRGLRQQMQRDQAEGQGEGEGPGEPGEDQRGRAEQNTDPLGRPLPQDRHSLDNGRVKIPQGGDVRGTIGERAQRVLEELRRRLGETIRPREELDYLERLLRQR